MVSDTLGLSHTQGTLVGRPHRRKSGGRMRNRLQPLDLASVHFYHGLSRREDLRFISLHAVLHVEPPCPAMKQIH